jgi:hypothetical protein
MYLYGLVEYVFYFGSKKKAMFKHSHAHTLILYVKRTRIIHV